MINFDLLSEYLRVKETIPLNKEDLGGSVIMAVNKKDKWCFVSLLSLLVDSIQIISQ